MATITDTMFEGIMQRLQVENARLMKQMLEEVTKVKQKETNMVDTQSIGKPPTFSGKEEKYYEWMAKLLAYLRLPESDAWIIWANSKTVVVDEGEIDLKYQEPHSKEVKDFSNQLFSTLITNCEDDAFKLVQSAGTGNGLEALRLLSKRYDPKNPGTKRSLSKAS